MRYRYVAFAQTRFLEGVGHYRAYGIRRYREDVSGLSLMEEVCDISADYEMVKDLAARCTALQLRPVHLMDVAMNAVP